MPLRVLSIARARARDVVGQMFVICRIAFSRSRSRPRALLVWGSLHSSILSLPSRTDTSFITSGVASNWEASDT